MDALELLKSLVAIPSVNPFRLVNHDELPSPQPGALPAAIGWGTETQMNLFIEEVLKASGFEVSRQMLNSELLLSRGAEQVTLPARWNVLGEKTGSTNTPKKSVLLMGHTDTVDVKHGWESDPFCITPYTVDSRERWYGLGANDMKGGLAAILAAGAAFTPTDISLKVAFVVDEEFYSLGAHALCQSDFLDDVALAILPEIGDGANTFDEQWVGLGRLGRREFEFEVIGNACHGADAFIRSDMVNAVHEAAKLEVALIQHCLSSKRSFSGLGTEHFARPVMNSLFLSQHTGGAATLSIPDKAGCLLDRTFLPDESAEQELRALNGLISKLQAEAVIDPRARISVRERARPTPACQPYFFDPKNPLIQLAIDAARKHAKFVSLGIGRSVADENIIAARGIPTVTLGPVGEGSHTAKEWVDPESVSRLTSIFVSILEKIRP